MPSVAINLPASHQQSAPVDEGFVTFEEELEVLHAAHSDVSAAKTYKLKVKIEDKKKEEETRKNYTAVIHNTISKNIINAQANVANFAEKVSETKLTNNSRSSAM